MANMQKMMKQAQKMQAKMMKAQEELAQKEVEGSAGGGMVKVVLNGEQHLKSISIQPDAVDPDDVEMLEDLIIAAFTNAQDEVKSLNDSTFGAITGGMNIPGM
jgi:DNA-binding YbaB/EbfC family protein